MKEASLLKVGIFGNDRVSANFCVLPNIEIVGIPQTHFSYMNAFWVNVRQQLREAR